MLSWNLVANHFCDVLIIIFNLFGGGGQKWPYAVL